MIDEGEAIGQHGRQKSERWCDGTDDQPMVEPREVTLLHCISSCTQSGGEAHAVLRLHCGVTQPGGEKGWRRARRNEVDGLGPGQLVGWSKNDLNHRIMQ